MGKLSSRIFVFQPFLRFYIWPITCRCTIIRLNVSTLLEILPDGVFASESGVYPIKKTKTGFMYKERWKPLTLEEGHPLHSLTNIVVLRNGKKVEPKKLEKKGDVVYITV